MVKNKKMKIESWEFKTDLSIKQLKNLLEQINQIEKKPIKAFGELVEFFNSLRTNGPTISMDTSVKVFAEVVNKYKKEILKEIKR